jgi:GT2 family glycosyltransferase
MTKVSIVIPVFNQFMMTRDCIRDIMKTYGVEIEIIVVDDCSYVMPAPATLGGFIKRMFPQVKVLINDENLGFAKTVNRGILEASHDLICLLNNDIRLTNPAWLKTMVESLDNDNLDMTAPAGGRMDGKWNYIPGEAKRRGEKFSYLVGWCLLVKRSVFDEIGLIPTDFGKGFFEDVLFGYRARRAGFKMDITEGTGVEHLYHKTFISEGYNLSEEYKEKRSIFLDIIKNEK